MNRTLYISDLDGTLLNANAELPHPAAEMLNKLIEKGVMITFATARTPATVVPIMHEVHTNLPAIVMTGAAMFTPSTLKYSNTHPLDPEQVTIVQQVCTAHGITPFVYVLRRSKGLIDAYHAAPELTFAERTFVEERNHLELKHFHFHSDEWQVSLDSDSCVILAFAMGKLNNAMRATDNLRKALPDCAVTCYQDTYMPNIGLIDIFRPGVSKAAAVKQLKEQLGATRVVVFGDNLNDLSMMSVADVSVAVANAVDEVRAKANVVIGVNTDFAVPRFIAYDSGLTQ